MKSELLLIIRKLKDDDQEIFVSLFRRYYIPLCTYARKYVGRKDVAEEIVSDTFYNIWCNRKTLEIHSSLKGYLFQAVYRNSLYYLRRHKHEALLEDIFSAAMMTSEEKSADADLTAAERKEDLLSSVEQAVSSLPPQQQTAFRLKRYEGKKLKEIASIMNLSVKTVEMHLTKAMRSLRQLLEEHHPGFILLICLINS
ncbi:MAG: RNA polymerase sigma-70 factor [Mangrovibacterium sp.]